MSDLLPADENWPGTDADAVADLADRFDAGEDLGDQALAGALASNLRRSRRLSQMLALNVARYAMPVATSRKTTEDLRHKPEADVMRIEVTAADFFKSGTLIGTTEADFLRALPPNAVPTAEFLAEIDAIEAELAQLDQPLPDMEELLSKRWQ